MRGIVLGLLLAAGCDKTGVIVVDVESNTSFANLDHLEVHVTNGGAPDHVFSLPLPQPTIPPAQTFSMSFGGDRSGDTQFTIYAVDAAGAKVAGVADHAELTPGKVVNQRVFLGNVCGDAFADLQTSGKHCGTCGHDCFGGACVAGACQPAIVAKADHPHGGDLAFVDGTVYWGEWDFQQKTGRLMRAALGGMPMQITPLTTEPWHIATDGKTLFMGSQPGVQSVPAAGGMLTVIAPMNGGGIFIVDRGYLYWSGPTGFERRRLSDNTTETLVMGQFMNSVAVDAAQKNAYYVGSFPNRMVPALVKVPLGGGAPTVLADQPTFSPGLGVDASNVYWVSSQMTGPGPLRSISIGGGAPSLVADTNRLYGLVVDGTHVYWVDDGTIWAMPSAGGTPVKLMGPPGHNAGNLVDGGDSLYFVDWNQPSISRLAK